MAGEHEFLFFFNILVPICAFRKRLQEDFQVCLIDLNDAGIERTMSRPRIASFLGIQERKTKFTTQKKKVSFFVHKKAQDKVQTFSVRRRNPMRP
jgi:hypothetical protein